MNREDKKNAFLYCKFRDEQYALYDEYAKSNGLLMNTFLVLNALFYAKAGITQKKICQREKNKSLHITSLLIIFYIIIT